MDDVTQKARKYLTTNYTNDTNFLRTTENTEHTEKPLTFDLRR